MRMLPLVGAALLTGALAACELDPPPSLSPLPPVIVGDRLAIADRDEESLLSITVEAGDLTEVTRTPLSGPPSAVVAVPGQPVALVLSRSARSLDRVDLDPTPPAVRTHDLGVAFEAVTPSPDGRFAVAWFPPDTASGVFHNEHEVALIDLDPARPAAEAVTRRTLPSLGGAPRIMTFSPEIDGQRYLFALSAEHVAIAAAGAPSRRERSVPLVSLTTGGTRTPRAVDFAVSSDAAGRPTLWAVITTAEANATVALAIRRRADAPDGEPDFDVHLSQLAGIGPGGTTALLTLPDPQGAERLHTLTTHPGTGAVTLTDVDTATGRTLLLSTGVDRLALFRGEGGRLEAIVFNSRTSASTFHVIDVEAFAAGDERAFRTRTTREPFNRVLPIEGTARFVLVRDGSSTGVGILNAGTDRVTTFGRTGNVRALTLSEDLDRLFALTRLDGQDYLVSVSLGDLHPQVSAVPRGGDTLLLIPERETVASWSTGRLDALVLWPAHDTRLERATRVPGLLLGGLLR